MRLIPLSLAVPFIVVPLLASCSGGGASGPGGEGLGADGGSSAPTFCVPQPENVRLQYCDATTSNVLMACDKGIGPPSEDCTKTLQEDAYCCPSDAPPPKADAGSESELNPYGVAYPTDHVGWNALTGTTRGDRIPNVSLQGYPAGSKSLGTVSLANLFDPEGRTHDVLVIVGGGVEETTGNTTLKVLGPMVGDSQTSSTRIAALAVVGLGKGLEAPATLSDLSTWRTAYSWATTALDPSFAAFEPAFDAEAVPLVMIIDSRTMEILDRGIGAFLNKDDLTRAIEDAMSHGRGYN